MRMRASSSSGCETTWRKTNQAARRAYRPREAASACLVKTYCSFDLLISSDERSAHAKGPVTSTATYPDDRANDDRRA